MVIVILIKKVIFIANSDERIKNAFGPNIYAFIETSDPTDYVSKIIGETISQILESSYITLKIKRMPQLFNIMDILYCQYIGANTIAFVYHNQQYMYKGSSLIKMKKILGEQFVHTDQSIIVNSKKIIDLENNKVYIDGIRQYFIISARNKTKIKRLFLQKNTNKYK